MFEDQDPDAPLSRDDQIEADDQQFFAALTLLGLAALLAIAWGYYVLTVGVYGPAQ